MVSLAAAGYRSALPGEPKKIGDPVDISDELAPLRGADDKYLHLWGETKTSSKSINYIASTGAHIIRTRSSNVCIVPS